jgi:hypothetical protein
VLKWARQHPSQTETSQEMNKDTKCTDKKETKIFLIYKEIQNGAVAKSYMTNGLLKESSYMGKYLRISSYIRKPFLVYDFATMLHSEFPYIY